MRCAIPAAGCSRKPFPPVDLRARTLRKRPTRVYATFVHPHERDIRARIATMSRCRTQLPSPSSSSVPRMNGRPPPRMRLDHPVHESQGRSAKRTASRFHFPFERQLITPYSMRPSSSITAVKPSAVSKNVIGASPPSAREGSRSHARPFSSPKICWAFANARATRRLRSVSSGVSRSPLASLRWSVRVATLRFCESSLTDNPRLSATFSNETEGSRDRITAIHFERSSGASKSFSI